MKKLLLLLLALLLTGCAAHPLSDAAVPLPAGVAAPSPNAPDALTGSDSVTLWFRYLDEPLLAPESRTLTLPADQPLELSLVSALLAGPDVQSAHLTALFPAGTRVLSTVRQGRTLFVTLSREIMGAYPDEPRAWRDDPYWAIEVPLRRKLCMQSLIATVTENCDVDAIQVLVESGGEATDSLRMRQGYYLTGGDEAALAEPLRRDDALLLTPSTTLRTLLTLWQQRDWTRLPRYLTDASLRAEALDSLPHLIAADFSGPSLTGGTATFTVSASLRGEAGAKELTAKPLRLRWMDGLWRAEFEALTGWLEDTP